MYAQSLSKRYRSWFQHHMNSVHVYCRLARITSRSQARHIAKLWEFSWIYSALYQPPIQMG